MSLLAVGPVREICVKRMGGCLVVSGSTTQPHPLTPEAGCQQLVTVLPTDARRVLRSDDVLRVGSVQRMQNLDAEASTVSEKIFKTRSLHQAAAVLLVAPAG